MHHAPYFSLVADDSLKLPHVYRALQRHIQTAVNEMSRISASSGTSWDQHKTHSSCSLLSEDYAMYKSNVALHCKGGKEATINK